MKKGGLGIFSIPDRYIEELGYKQQIDKMEAEGIVKFVHSELYDNFTKNQEEEAFLKPTPTHVYVYVKLWFDKIDNQSFFTLKTTKVVDFKSKYY